jgi:ADP-L-glycero-D-manno-heptose 6-epimerase
VLFRSLNLHYSKDIWRICTANEIPLVYASSAATYGDGDFGFSDDHAVVSKLKPLNAYAQSKQDFDQWVLTQDKTPPRWYGLKFFNVYGPNEYHKARMASVIFHAFHQIRDIGKLKLFKSHRPEWKDGGQERDFIFVKDVLQMVWNVFELKPESGLYNVGTGKVKTFQDLGLSTFAALGLQSNIEYIDMPIDLQEKYQYFTEADMSKWIAANLPLPATSLEDGVKDYIQHYLTPSRYL